MTLLAPRHEVPSDFDAEALIKEARRLRRRRWFFGIAASLVVLAGTLIVISIGGSGNNGARTGSESRQSSSSSIGSPSRSKVVVASDVLPFVGDTDLFAPGVGWVASGTLAEVTFDDGAHWELFRPPSLSGDLIAQIEGFAAIGTKDWWVGVALSPSAAPVPGTSCGVNSSVLDFTTNAGESWQRTALPGCVGASELSFPTKESGYVLGGWPKPTLFTTSDGGRTWSSLGIPPFSGPMVFSSVNDGWGIATVNHSYVYGVALLRTTDGGRAWHQVSVPKVNLAPHEALSYRQPQVFGDATAIVPVMIANSQGQVVRVQVDVTRNGGRSWRVISTPKTVSTTNRAGLDPVGSGSFEFNDLLSAVSPTHWIFGSGENLYVTNNAGKNWSLMTKVFVKAHQSIQGVQFVSRNSGWVTTRSSLLYATSDGGKHWTKLSDNQT